MNGGDWGFWVVQGMPGIVGFNWQLGSLATSPGQGGVVRAERLVRQETRRSDLLCFFFSSHIRKPED